MKPAITLAAEGGTLTENQPMYFRARDEELQTVKGMLYVCNLASTLGDCGCAHCTSFPGTALGPTSTLPL